MKLFAVYKKKIKEFTVVKEKIFYKYINLLSHGDLFFRMPLTIPYAVE